MARGPFTIPAAFPQNNQVGAKVSEHDVDQFLKYLPMSLFSTRKDQLLKELIGQRVDLAIEGSRHARSPSGLGEQPYEGAAILILSPGSEIAPNVVLQKLQTGNIGTEKIHGIPVLVFQEKMEDDLWTLYVAFPDKEVAIVATDRGYLEEILTLRKGGDKQRRAFPESLPEWKVIDKEALYFGIRHYDPTQAKSDPSSPFGGTKAANFPDERAIGFAFSASTTNPRRVSMTYFSGDQAMTPERSPFHILSTSPDAQYIDSQFRSVRPGVVQVSCSFKKMEGLDFFVFLLEGFMGHAIYA